MDKKEKHELGIDQFLDELTAGNTTQDAQEIRRRLFTLYKIRSILKGLQEKGIQLLEPSSMQRSEMEPSEDLMTKTTLDFILRNENVELQLEIKYPEEDKLFLNIEDFQRYYKVILDNAKTEEILISWDNSDLSTLTLNPAQIQRYLTSSEQLINIDKTYLAPLIEAVVYTFEKHRPDWMRETRIEMGEVTRHDSRDLFREALRENIKRLKATAEIRRYEDRKKALESISEYDIQQLERIFDKSRTSELTVEDINELMEKFIP